MPLLHVAAAVLLAYNIKMGTSVFMDKTQCPGEEDIRKELGKLYDTWNSIKEYSYQNFPGSKEEWHYSKHGWNARIKDKKRAVVYFMPCSGYFTVSFVFGEKATKEALDSLISEDIKTIIKTAPVYGEGRGFRIEVRDKKPAKEIEKLLQIKKAF